LENLGADGRIIFKTELQQVAWAGTHWISLTQDRDRWWVLVYVVMKLWVP